MSTACPHGILDWRICVHCSPHPEHGVMPREYPRRRDLETPTIEAAAGFERHQSEQTRIAGMFMDPDDVPSPSDL
jgi:hypothetical protein